MGHDGCYAVVGTGYYLYHEAPPDEQNFPMVMEMLRAGEVREEDDSYQSPLDVLFERLEMRDRSISRSSIIRTITPAAPKH